VNEQGRIDSTPKDTKSTKQEETKRMGFGVPCLALSS